MTRGLLILRGLTVLLVGLISSVDLAAAQGNTSPVNALPRVYVQDLQTTVASNAISGSFTATNSEPTTVGNIRYEISVLGAALPATPSQLANTTPVVYDRSLNEQVITLGPQQNQLISFSYQAPPLPSASYRLRIQLTAGNGRQLGWRDAPVTLGGAENFVSLTPVAVRVASTNPLDATDARDQWAPFEGVNVNPSEPVTLEATARATSSAPLILTPTVTLSRLFAPQAAATTIRGETVTLAAGAEQIMSIPLTAPLTPGSYQAVLNLHTEANSSVSNLAEFRLVTRGVSASIVTAAVRNFSGTDNSTTTIDFLLAGPADRQTQASATLEASLYNGDRIIGTATSALTLGPAAQPGSAQLQLTEDLTGQPRLVLTLTDSTGTPLDSYEVPVPPAAPQATPPPSRFTSKTMLGIGIGILILALLTGSIWFWNRRRTPPPLPPAPVAVLLVAAATLLLGNLALGQTSGIQFKDCVIATPSPTPATSPAPESDPCAAWSLFVNSPDAGDRSQVAYDARFEWVVSGNAVSNSTVSVYALGGGGGTVMNRTITSQQPDSQALGRTVEFTTAQPASTFTIVVPPQQQSTITDLSPWLAQGRGIGTGVTGDSAPSLYFSGTFNLAEFPATTTLWTEALSNTDNGSQIGVIDDFLWLTPPASPSPGASPTTSPSAAGCLVVGRTVTAAAACQQAQVSLSLRNTCAPHVYRAPLDIIMVLDRSGSMQGQKLTDAKTAARSMVDQLDANTDRIGLVSYADTGRVDVQLTNNFAQVKSAVSSISANGSTNIGDGVYQGRTALQSARADAVPALVVLTDGIANRQHQGSGCTTTPTSPTPCTNDAINQAAAAKQAGQTVFTIGLGLQQASGGSGAALTLARSMLQQMASTADKFYDAPSSGQLTTIFATIANQLKNTLAENTVITDVLAPGVHLVPDSAVPPPASIDGQTLRWNIGTVSSTQEPRITFQVTFDTAGTQPITVYPTSQTTYSDNRNQNSTTISPETRYSPNSCIAPPQCSDTTDNDGDGKVDCDDIGCRTKPADSSTCDPNDDDEKDPGFQPGGIQETE